MSSSPISFGDAFSASVENFKTAFSNIKPRIGSCLLLAVPFALICYVLALVILGGSIAAGMGAASGTADEDTAAVAVIMSVILGLGLFLIAILPFAAYFGFCSGRFTARACANPAQTFSFGSLYAYESSLWSFLGLGFLQLFIGALVSILAGIVCAVLFFLLGLPAYPIYFFWLVFCACSAFALFDSPSSGVSAALSRGWSLTTRDWKRWLAMSIVMIGAAIAYVFISFVLSFTIGLIPVIGQIAITVASILINFYCLFVFYSAYRDSAASAGHSAL